MSKARGNGFAYRRSCQAARAPSKQTALGSATGPLLPRPAICRAASYVIRGTVSWLLKPLTVAMEKPILD